MSELGNDLSSSASSLQIPTIPTVSDTFRFQGLSKVVPLVDKSARADSQFYVGT